MSENVDELLAEYRTKKFHPAYWGLNAFTDRLFAALETLNKENATAWERGIRDMHDHNLVYDAWSYGRREYPGAGPVNPYNGQVFKRESVWSAPPVSRMEKLP